MPDAFAITQLAGPLGGMLALAFGAGTVGGYGFASRTLVKLAREQIGKMEAAAEKERGDFKRDIELERAERKVALREEREECDRRIDKLERRIHEMEIMQSLKGDQPLRVGDLRQTKQVVRSASAVIADHGELLRQAWAVPDGELPD